jgi:hypothetical protein
MTTRAPDLVKVCLDLSAQQRRVHSARVHGGSHAGELILQRVELHGRRDTLDITTLHDGFAEARSDAGHKIMATVGRHAPLELTQSPDAERRHTVPRSNTTL